MYIDYHSPKIVSKQTPPHLIVTYAERPSQQKYTSHPSLEKRETKIKDTHQLLGTSRMNSNTSIKIPLSCPHLNRNPKPLHHLRAPQAQNMQADNLLLGALTHNFVLGRLLLLLLGRMEGVEHGREAGVVNFDVFLAEFFDGLGFGEADGAAFWVREDDGGDEAVVEFRVGEVGAAGGVGSAEEAVGELAAGCYGHWDELVLMFRVTLRREDLPGVSSAWPVTSPMAYMPSTFVFWYSSTTR